MASSQEKRTPLAAFDPTVLAQIACPVCFGDLEFAEACLTCTGCRRAYLVIDGIPTLIVDRTETSTEKR
jgi:uncharacterized protein YbaR (Trm112 family)